MVEESITLLKLFTWIIFDPYVLVLKPQLAQLSANLQMSMLVMCDTVYLKKGNYYGVKFNVCNDMLGIYVNYMILLVVLKTLRNTL